jgi:hypothetical protein
MSVTITDPFPPPEVTPDREIGGTRSSNHWTHQPGNMDRLNCRALWPTDNEWGIPVLPPTRFEPAQLVAYSDRRACTAAAGTNAAVHFFLDDYRFETLWSKPERGLSRCAAVGAALTPDFSLWTDMPLAMQLWQVYRSRWVGCWLLHHGIHVVPTVSWSTPDSYPFAFAGIAPGSVVAVSTVGIQRDPVARGLFADGFAAMMKQLRPSTVLIYGRPPTEQVRGWSMIRCYADRWEAC